MNQYLFIIRGPPGSGKSTVSKLLASKLDGSVALLDSDWLRHEMILKRSEGFNDHVLLYKNLWNLTENSLSEGLNVIIDGILTSRDAQGNFRIHKYDDYKSKSGIKLVKAFLKSSLDVQKSRIIERGRVLKDDDVSSWSKEAFESLSGDELIIDTTNKSVEEIVNLILDFAN